MYNIYIMVSYSGTYFSRFLRCITGIRYPHVSISLDRHTFYSFGRKRVNNPLYGGFVEERQNEGVYAIHNATCEILKLVVTDEQYNHLCFVIDTFKRNNAIYKYNFTGLIATYLRVPMSLNTRFTCTQFVATALTSANIVSFKSPSLVFPDEYYRIPKVKKVYSGKFNEYIPA